MLDLNYESRREPLLSRRGYAERLVMSFGAALLLIAVSLACGMCGYKYLEDMSWVDAFVNAAMILSGMGPVETLHTNAGKIFAGCYALYSGLALILATGLIFAPVVHRLMHRFNIEEDA